MKAYLGLLHPDLALMTGGVKGSEEKESDPNQRNPHSGADSALGYRSG